MPVTNKQPLHEEMDNIILTCCEAIQKLPLDKSKKGLILYTVLYISCDKMEPAALINDMGEANGMVSLIIKPILQQGMKTRGTCRYIYLKHCRFLLNDALFVLYNYSNNLSITSIFPHAPGACRKM